MRQQKTQARTGRMILPTLSLSTFISGAPGVLIGLLLVDIGLTYNQPVGVIGQIGTLSSILAIVTAIALSVLSVRFDARKLLMLGVGLQLLSALGSGTANSFLMLLVFYAINGLGLPVVVTMTRTLVAHYFTEDKRANALGWVTAGGSLSWVIGAQVITYLAGIGGWRLPYIAFIVTSLVMGLFCVIQFLPPPKIVDQKTQVNLTAGIKAIVTSRSAISCLISTLFRIASFQLILVYSASYFRQQFLLSREITSLLITMSALCFTGGSILSGRIVYKFGRKRVAWSFLLLGGVFLALLTNISNPWLTYGVYFLGPLVMGISFPANVSLFLEQIPQYRGGMMALITAFANIGSALGAALGGVILLWSSYSSVGITLGSLSIIGSMLLYFFVKDIL